MASFWIFSEPSSATKNLRENSVRSETRCDPIKRRREADVLVAGQGGDVDGVAVPLDGGRRQAARAARQRRDASKVAQRFERHLFLQQRFLCFGELKKKEKGKKKESAKKAGRPRGNEERKKSLASAPSSGFVYNHVLGTRPICKTPMEIPKKKKKWPPLLPDQSTFSQSMKRRRGTVKGLIKARGMCGNGSAEWNVDATVDHRRR